MHNGTRSLLYPKPHMNLVAFKWIFWIKRSVDRSVERYKAFLVASTTQHLNMVRLSALWSFQAGYHSHYPFSCCLSQLGYPSPWCHECLFTWLHWWKCLLNHLVLYIPSFPNHVYHLNMELYGLKQAPQEWYPRLSSRLLDLGFASFKSNTSLFIYRTSSELILFLIYVDEIIVTSLSSSSISRLIKTLQNDFAFKDLGPLHFFLRVGAINIDSGLFLSQRRYISDLRKPTCITKPISSPMASNKTLKSIYWEFIGWPNPLLQFCGLFAIPAFNVRWSGICCD